jgi:hypothetical protein
MRHFVLVVLVAAGCAETNDSARIAPYLVDAVQVSKIEPADSCRALGALDGTSDEDCDSSRYESAYAALRTHAALRGGNYVVIDAITSSRFGDGPDDRAITINGRLYACPIGPYPTTQLSLAMPRPQQSPQ